MYVNNICMSVNVYVCVDVSVCLHVCLLDGCWHVHTKQSGIYYTDNNTHNTNTIVI